MVLLVPLFIAMLFVLLLCILQKLLDITVTETFLSYTYENIAFLNICVLTLKNKEYLLSFAVARAQEVE